MSIRLGSGTTGGVPRRSRKARAPIAVFAAGALVAAGAVTPALAADTTKVLMADYANALTVQEVDGGTVTWEPGGTNGVVTLATGPSSASKATIHLELLPSLPPVPFGDLNQIAYDLTASTSAAAALSFELIVDDPGPGFSFPAVQFVPPAGTTGTVDTVAEDPLDAADGFWRLSGSADQSSLAELQAEYGASTINKIYLSVGSSDANSSSSVDSVTVGTAAGATIYDFQVPPPPEPTQKTVRPGELGEGQVDGWDLVASIGDIALNIGNNSGWSQDADGTGYAVLDPAFTSPAGEMGVISLVTGNYNPDLRGNIPLSAIDDSPWLIRLKTVGEGIPPVVQLRVGGVTDKPDCRISYSVGSPVPEFTEFSLLAAPAPTGGGWTDFLNDGGDGDCIGAGLTWAEVLTQLGPDAFIRGGIGAPGVSISTGATNDSGYAVAHIDSFTIMGDAYDFEAPILTMTGDPQTIEAGQSASFTLATTLTGPNQPTIENNANFLTGPGGLTSSGVVAVTSEPAGLCTVQSSPAATYDPVRALWTRPFLDNTDVTRPQVTNTGFGPVAVDDPAIPLTVTLTTETTNGGVGVSQGGTCTIGLVPPAGGPANADLVGSVTLTVLPTEDTRPALDLPDEVPASTGALTVTPDCVVDGDTITVTAPAGSFSPDSQVSLGLYDSMIDLGVVTADPSGGLNEEITVPTGVPDGTQELLAVGYAGTDNDDPVYLSADVAVSICADAGSGGVPSGIPAGAGGAGDTDGLLGTGLALLALGGCLALRLRRTFGA